MSNTTNEAPGCLGIFLKMIGFAPKPGTKQALPYRLRDDFLSRAEVSFYHVLLSVTADSLTVCPKVGLKDIFRVVGGQGSQAALNKIDRKHVDFLLCDAKSMQPLCGIELDDASHARSDRQERDGFVDQVFSTAGLPLLHFPAQASYNVHEVAERLAATLNPATETPESASGASVAEVEASSTDTSAAPICPKCGIPLVLRDGKRGQFYGCSNYPRCRETAAVG